MFLLFCHVHVSFPISPVLNNKQKLLQCSGITIPRFDTDMKWYAAPAVGLGLDQALHKMADERSNWIYLNDNVRVVTPTCLLS